MKFRSRLFHRTIVFTHDLFMIAVAWLGAYWLRFNLSFFHWPVWVTAFKFLPLIIALQLMTATWMGCYRGVWRFASIPDLIRIIKAVAIGTLLVFCSIFIFNRLNNVPRAVFPMYAILLTACWTGPRVMYRMMRDHFSIDTQGKRVLIVGAGQEGESLVRDLLRHSKNKLFPVAFLDDHKSNLGRDIQGIRVVGMLHSIEDSIRKYNISFVMFALPSATSQQMQQLIKICDQHKIPYRILPSLTDLAENRVTINSLRRVEIEDLLGRDPVQLDWQEISNSIRDKTILITGGGGSIGSELCRQILSRQPRHLIICDNCEFNLYQITQELGLLKNGVQLTSLLVDVSDSKFVNSMLNQYRPDVIFHAAAYKHVPILENQLFAATKNNIFATRTLADLAVQYRVKNFILVSSDKAVNPTNIMGLSKRIAEIYCQNLNQQGVTSFVTVRFGNVLGSTGSVVPLFRKQLESGGPITVTHPDMTRYFMTIPEATSLILQSYVVGKGGEIFVLDMGQPVRISYLAEQMIRLSGKEPGKDIKIEYTGIRPGEKLFEELFHNSESLKSTRHQKISLADSRQVDWVTLIKYFDDIEFAYQANDVTKLLNILRELVPEYHSENIG